MKTNTCLGGMFIVTMLVAYFILYFCLYIIK
jgi:hypothetical protein